MVYLYRHTDTGERNESNGVEISPYYPRQPCHVFLFINESSFISKVVRFLCPIAHTGTLLLNLIVLIIRKLLLNYIMVTLYHFVLVPTLSFWLEQCSSFSGVHSLI